MALQMIFSENGLKVAYVLLTQSLFQLRNLTDSELSPSSKQNKVSTLRSTYPWLQEDTWFHQELASHPRPSSTHTDTLLLYDYLILDQLIRIWTTLLTSTPSPENELALELAYVRILRILAKTNIPGIGEIIHHPTQHNQ